MKYIIANWKSNKNLSEIESWSDTFLGSYKMREDRTIIICPPFPLMHPLGKKLFQVSEIKIGSQDISSFDQGPYTGEVNAATLSHLVEYIIIGHSERRKYFNETEDVIKKKVDLAKKYNINSILCIRNHKDVIYEGASFVAYESENSISTGPVGKEEPVEKVVLMKKRLNLSNEVKFIYGGNVHEGNCKKYLSADEIDGVLIGSASLDPNRFVSILNHI